METQWKKPGPGRKFVAWFRVLRAKHASVIETDRKMIELCGDGVMNAKPQKMVQSSRIV